MLWPFDTFVSRVTHAFQSQISVADFHSLERTSAVTYAVDSKLRLAYVNPAWEEFAARNGGRDIDQWPIGRSILDAIAPVIRVFYYEAMKRVLNTGEDWEHVYEASSADLLRIVRMHVSRVGRGPFLLVTNSVVVERPHDEHERRKKPADDEKYVRHDGRILMCCGCRRVRRASNDGWWDWVPEYLNGVSARVEQNLCPGCLDFYFPDSEASSKAIRRPRMSEIPVAFTRH